MAHSISFDTPPSSTPWDVLATGNVAAWSTGHVMIQLKVTTTAATGTTNRYFYKEKNYSNSTGSTVLPVSETFQLAITPMAHNETVQENVWFSYAGTRAS